jgi:LPS-assembly lipoprotein
MWWRDCPATDWRPSRALARFGVAIAAACLLAGCFQPLYGDHSVTGGTSVGDKMATVQVLQIDAPKATPEERIAVQLRNDLLFAMNGGAASQSPAYKLAIRIATTRLSTIVDVESGRPDIEVEGIEASYSLTELATGKVVVTGQAFARASYDIPGSEQRFARIRALRDTENRTATVVADQIKSRLASYFVAGT